MEAAGSELWHLAFGFQASLKLVGSWLRYNGLLGRSRVKFDEGGTVSRTFVAVGRYSACGVLSGVRTDFYDDGGIGEGRAMQLD